MLKVNKSVYMAKLEQWHDKLLNNFLLYVLIHNLEYVYA